MKINPLLIIDFYKATHAEQYNPNITKIVSYFTPRMCRVNQWKKVVFFGLQGFIKEYLIDSFNENFFNKSIDEIIEEYERIMLKSLKHVPNTDGIRKLHKLGYLPIKIRAIDEGEKVDIKVPLFEISNTHPDFAWVVGALETFFSCNLWHPIISATVGDSYKKIVSKYYYATVEDGSIERALSDFSMRGQESTESAIRSSAAFCLSFQNTATVPAIPYLERYYNANIDHEDVAFGGISTEHSVMCSNFAIDGDEITFVKKLLTEIYPNNNFSMVSDSYDYWSLITEILPQCKKEIELHNGFIGIRGDSGDPIDIICGLSYPIGFKLMDSLEVAKEEIKNLYNLYVARQILDKNTDELNKSYRVGNKYYDISASTFFEKKKFLGFFPYFKKAIKLDVKDVVDYAKWVGTVELLWNIFGGTVNSKGYKVLNPKIKAIYGDSITIERAEEIYRRLEEKGFAANNVLLGVGSFSMQCIEENGILKPFTRDTFGIACKATYCETNDNTKHFIFKNPKTDDGHFKKSQKGCCLVYKNELGNYDYRDGLLHSESDCDENLLKPVFEDGIIIKDVSLDEIRQKLKTN